MKKKMNKNLTVGLWLTGIMLTLILVGFFWTPYNPETMDNAAKLSGVSFSHLMGCDNFGRDIFSRVLKGGGTTFFVALGTVAIGTVFGVIIGAFTGYFGGIVDEVIMRINDALNSFPSILMALVVVSILGTGSRNVIIALSIVFIPSFVRVVRSEYMRCRNADYITNARLMGVGRIRIMFVHILPNIMSTFLVAVTVGFNNAILAESGLSYLGIGVQPPDASLGKMLSDAQGYLFTAPWYAVFPGLTIVLFVLGFSLIGEGIQRNNRR